MAGGRLILPASEPVLTSGGLLNVGATLTVYNTGTTTKSTIYADVALTTPISNPQISNSAGRFYTQSTQICADATVAYDCVLTLTDGETFSYTAIYALGAAPTISGYAPLNSPAFTGVPTAPTPAANDTSSKIATTQFVATAIATAVFVPPGQYGMFAMSALPSGWMLCDGTAISRTTYAALFAVINTVYGVGNGTTTFNVPNFLGYFPRALNTTGAGPDPSRALGTVQAGALASHQHNGGVLWDHTSGTGPFVYGATTQDAPGFATGIAVQGNTGSFGSSNLQGLTNNVGGTETRPSNLAVVIAIHT